MKNQETTNTIIAGLCQHDSNIEFFGIKDTKKVKWIQNGVTHNFSELKGEPQKEVIKAYESDQGAKDYFKTLVNEKGQTLPYIRRVELYIYYCYGELDNVADMINGVLGPSENFRDNDQFLSRHFCRKHLRINGNKLKPREICMIDCFAKDYKDSTVAGILSISVPTFNQHKRSLYDKAGVNTKPGLMIQASKDKLILQ